MLVEVASGVLVGCVGGFASGLLGITSGGILVPLLVLLIGEEQHVAQGVSLVAQVVPTSLSGVRGYQRAGHSVPLVWVGWLAAGFGVGGCLGAALATLASGAVLQWTFVGYLVLLLALVLLRPPPRAEAGADGEAAAAQQRLHAAALLTIGMIAGWSSGFLGIGGGLAITALMTGLLKQSQHRSQAISLAVTALPVTLPAAALYVQQGHALPWPTIGGLIAGLWVGTSIGAAGASRIKAARLRTLLALLIAAMAALMALRAMR